MNEQTVFKAKDGATIQFSALAVNNKVEVKPATGVAETVTLK